MLIELAIELGLDPKRVSSSRGGEFHSSCPVCGGRDRFIIWPGKEYYWCRQCKRSGDGIQFCRDFLGMSFQDACIKVGDIRTNPFSYHPSDTPIHSSFLWKEKAAAFVKCAHDRLLLDSVALHLVRARGLRIETIKQHQIGWNPVPVFPPREGWGLETKIEDGKVKKLLLPQGIVLPAFENNQLEKIKIRRSHWKEGDRFGKYYIVPGSRDITPVFGDPNHPIVLIIEAEFDAMLVIQEVGDRCCCLALGGAQKRPEELIHRWLNSRKLILFALDFDYAGKAEYTWWQTIFPQLEPWPVPEEKSPGDYFIKGGNLQAWISSGIDLFLLNGNGNP